MIFLIFSLCTIMFFVLFIYCVPFRLVILHPISTIKDGLLDAYKYFKYHEYDILQVGKLVCLSAHFGGGKTLSLAEIGTYLYGRYNNKYIFDRRDGVWKLQKVHLLSNVTLTGVPCEPLDTLAKMTYYGEKNKSIDTINDTRTCTIVLLDEASTQLNSRNFRENFSWDTLNTLLTSRHLLMSVYYTSQKFKLVDALLRSVTQQVYSCRKIWRFMVQYVYSADELELATDVSLIRPIARKGFYVKDKHYNAYDTLALVTKLKKSMDDGDMLTDKEIIEMRGEMNPDNDSIVNPSRKLKRLRKAK